MEVEGKDGELENGGVVLWRNRQRNTTQPGWFIGFWLFAQLLTRTQTLNRIRTVNAARFHFSINKQHKYEEAAHIKQENTKHRSVQTLL